MNEGMDARRTLAFLEGLEGVPEPCLLEGAKRECGGAERHMVATEWGRDTHTGRRGRKRKREAQYERGWAF